ncbi:protein spinster [Drosophila madeirensis]|uniref:Protein spinster n=1 Tax=Drosophila madeirensis TaxID=30013 RepID=A0AAU9GC99_DROMD
MSQKHQKQSYQPLPTAAAAMDNPAMSQSSSSGGSNDDVANIPPTYSSQQLMPSDSDSMEEARQLRPTGATANLAAGLGLPPVPTRLSAVGRSQWFTVGVLCFVNLINYMDRFTIAGVLKDVQEDFKIGNDSAGLLQTVFVISYMICAPVFGYLGDRYSRPWIMAVGVALWCTTTLLGSYMQSFGWFITFRALVGIGEASYSTIAPTIISDLFVNDMRSKMLAMFYFAIPVGSGMGYIVGSKTAHLANNWRWALRVTPILGVAAVLLIMLIKDPERGHSEGSHSMEATSYRQDIKELLKNRSFMLSTAGFTCVAFVAGALAWWGPSFIFLGMKMQPGNENIVQDDISYKFGIVAMLAGLIGVPMGSVLAQRLRGRMENCDPYICAGGLLVSAPMVFAALVVSRTSGSLCFFFVFLAQVALNLCWSIVADILLVSWPRSVSSNSSRSSSNNKERRLLMRPKPSPKLAKQFSFRLSFLAKTNLKFKIFPTLPPKFSVAFNFGVITMVAGLVGVPLGSFLSQYMVKRYQSADPVICAFGLLLSAPLLFGACLMVSSNELGTYLLIFFGQLALNLNWAVVADILLYVVVPTRRSTAEAFQILISHALGDAGSPYLVGAMSEVIMKHLRNHPGASGLTNELQSMSQVVESQLINATDLATKVASEAIHSFQTNLTKTAEKLTEQFTEVEQFEGLQYALFSTSFVEVLGGIFFLFTACFILKDKYKAARSVADAQEQQQQQRDNPIA